MALTIRSISEEAAPTPAQDLEKLLAAAAAFVRRHAIAAIYHAGSGHPGGAMSAADLLACLFGAELNFWPNAIEDADRDRFVLSKGHAAPALYGIGAHYGFCDSKAALGLRKLGSAFQGHPHALDLPWVDASTGSLGQGFSVALGMAMGLKLKRSTARVYRNDAIMRLEPLTAKWRAFDWAIAEIDGHDIVQILSTLRRAGATHHRPSVIIAHTTKGKGVSFMENNPSWHGSVKLTREQADEALLALGANRNEIKEFLDVDGS
jgi:transketolase